MILEISMTLSVEQEFSKLTRTGKALWAGKLWGNAVEETYTHKGVEIHDKSVLIWLK